MMMSASCLPPCTHDVDARTPSSTRPTSAGVRSYRGIHHPPIRGNSGRYPAVGERGVQAKLLLEREVVVDLSVGDPAQLVRRALVQEQRLFGRRVGIHDGEALVAQVVASVVRVTVLRIGTAMSDAFAQLHGALPVCVRRDGRQAKDREDATHASCATLPWRLSDGASSGSACARVQKRRRTWVNPRLGRCDAKLLSKRRKD